MIIAYWHKKHPEVIDLTDDEILPWINANWIEKRPATEEEVKMYKNKIVAYMIKKGEAVCFGGKKTE